MKKQVLRPGRVLNLWVQPRASKNEILGFREDFLRIRVTAAPTDGAANRLCQQLLADALGVSLSSIQILGGHHSRRKRVRVPEVNTPLWEEWKQGPIHDQ